MTVIRVPGDRVEEYVRAAQDDDRAVAAGVLSVLVSVWDVGLTG
jgi:hypothetical protein